MPIPYHYTANSRGLGVADMAAAVQSGRPHRANGDLAFHVLRSWRQSMSPPPKTST